MSPIEDKQKVSLAELILWLVLPSPAHITGFSARLNLWTCNAHGNQVHSLHNYICLSATQKSIQSRILSLKATP